ncbi:hypothetical protein Poli38472_000066 [Pythium oligandrum]|uniref:Uncharacterized protein n=1 Tax=Pythium oligandrum TaxID=41045 RepID=A0A8K1CAZ8_PYTOL|nr:hypothetical protein Poli38472_000066 [Pythium oligandrum]|eukprot:TMW60024.1 hypothetical protein Poli38472_000066 [Pythium oligandrum]
MDAAGAAFGLGSGASGSAQVSGSTAFKEARPLSDQIVECLKFLRRIDRVVISDVIKSEYIIDVYFQHGKDGKTPGSMTPSCTTKHSFDALKNLHKSCVSWIQWHVELDKRYEVPPCSYCGAFNDPHAIDQWPGKSDKFLLSKKKMARVLEARLNEYVQAARVEPQGLYLCEGSENIPSLVAVFLLKGVDTTRG